MKKKPEVAHLRVFGCDAHAHVPKDERKKLDPKAKKYIFVGYGEETKGYRSYDPTRSKIIYSRDVVFVEGKCNADDATEFGVEQYVELTDELPCESDSEDSVPAETQPAPAESAVESAVRRSTRKKQSPDYFGRSANLVIVSEPRNVEEAMNTPEKNHWLEAMQKEMDSLKQNDVWELVALPEGRKPVGSKWVFKTKLNADGKIERYKARLVAQGFSQIFGSDYDETFCPVVRMESVCTLIAMSVQYGLQLHQVDVTTAFLNGRLEEEVFMSQPEGFIAHGRQYLVCRLKKSIYGLKKSPRCWNTTLDGHLKSLGFVQANSDPCIYRSSGGEMCLLGVYVDDSVVAAKSVATLEEVK